MTELLRFHDWNYSDSMTGITGSALGAMTGITRKNYSDSMTGITRGAMTGITRSALGAMTGITRIP